MMFQLTKRQHYVPDFYVRQWAGVDGKITCHDLAEKRTFSTNPINLLLERYFYQQDPDNPDNRIEKILSEMETACRPTFAKLAAEGQKAFKTADRRRAAWALQIAVTPVDLDNLKRFAAYQYLRVPGAIDRKTYEIQPSQMSDAAKNNALNPGRFVETGYEYLKRKFQSLKVQIFLSSGIDFITSDWPCFDLKDSSDAPSWAKKSDEIQAWFATWHQCIIGTQISGRRPKHRPITISRRLATYTSDCVTAICAPKHERESVV
jgi:hypothetical protein